MSAFVAFSVLVGVSVAVSNGNAPAPWTAAAARESASPDGARAPAGSPDDAPAPEGEAHDRPSLFALAPDPAGAPGLGPVAPSEGGAPALDGAGPRILSVADLYGGHASSLAPADRAPATFEGELPVNTIIAPAQPVTVLDGGQFGWRIAPDNGQRDFHNGTDISVAQGTPVVAALDGTVTAVFWDVWGGNRVEVSHADGLKTTYNHMQHVMVSEGDALRASEQLGTVGQTGLRVTGPHLHFETYVNGQAVDAQSFDWKTGEAIIPASRPQHSFEDQAPVAQPPVDAAAPPGTDNGSLADLPRDDHEHLVALSESTAPARDATAAGPGAGGKTPSVGPGAATSGAEKDAALQAAGKQDAGKKFKGTAAPKDPPAGATGTATKPSREPADRKPGTPEHTAAGADKNAVPPAGPAPQPGKDNNKVDKDQRPNKTDRPTPGKDTVGKPATEKPAQEGTPKPVTPTPSPKPTVTGPEKPADPPTKEPVAPPSGGTGGANHGAGPGGGTPTGSNPANPGTGSGGGTPTQPGGTGGDQGSGKPKPDGSQQGNGQQNPPQHTGPNPLTAPIPQLTTLEQIQQRTRALLDGDVAPVGGSLSADLAALSGRLSALGAGTQNPGFADQLTTAQEAVERAEAAPGDQQLAGRMKTELGKLRGLVAHAASANGSTPAQSGK